MDFSCINASEWVCFLGFQFTAAGVVKSKIKDLASIVPLQQPQQPPVIEVPLALFAGDMGGRGSADGTGSAARFSYPVGVATDNTGNVYVADTSNDTIRKITSEGVVTTLAGTISWNSGSADGTGAVARFSFLTGVATDSVGNIYVANNGNHTIRKITSEGVVTTFAGTAENSGSADGTGAAARFHCPNSVATDNTGNVYVADTDNHTIRKITSAGVVTTLAGTAGNSGSADGTGSVARFSSPDGVATDSAGNVYVADSDNHTIRKITSEGVVTTLAGTAGNSGSADGTGAAARFSSPVGVATDNTGNVYVADANNHTIRKITAAGVVTTLAGTAGNSGSADGTGFAARFCFPGGVATDNTGNVYVADSRNHIIRKITAAGVVTTLAGTAENSGSADGTRSVACFSCPEGVATDNTGNVYVADTSNDTIRKITSKGVVTTFAGTAGNSGSTDGTGSAARFHRPNSVATDNTGNVYVTDSRNHTIRKITSAGVVTTLAGTAMNSGSTDGTGSAACFFSPTGVATDSAGNIYVADSRNHTIRKITSAGVVTTLAGVVGQSGFVPGALPSYLDYPMGVAVSGNSLYITLYNGVAKAKINKKYSSKKYSELPKKENWPCSWFWEEF